MRAEVLREFKKAGHDITAEQWTILTFLWQRKEATQVEIANKTGRDRPAISRLIDSLERRQLVKRKQLDRRTNKIVLSEQGIELHKLLLPIFSDLMNRLSAKISEQNLEATADALMLITQSLKAD